MSARLTRCFAAPKSAPPTTNWAGITQPARNFARRPTGEADSNLGGAGAGRSSHYSDFFDALFGAAGRAAPRAATEDHHAKVMLDLEASLQWRFAHLTLRVPEIEAGHLALKERVLNVKVPKGILAGQTIRLAGQGARSSDGGLPGICTSKSTFSRIRSYKPTAATCMWTCR